jgi:hypothetical protein
VKKMIEIRKCGVAEILDVGDAQGLIANYAEECLIPDAAPQRWMYLAMEETGVLTCFGAFTGDIGSPACWWALFCR